MRSELNGSRTRLVCLLLRRGYGSRHNAVNMDVDLRRDVFDTAADEQRLTKEGFEIRRLMNTPVEMPSTAPPCRRSATRG